MTDEAPSKPIIPSVAEGSSKSSEFKTPASLAALLGIAKRPRPSPKPQTQSGPVKTSMNKPWSLVVKDPMSAATGISTGGSLSGLEKVNKVLPPGGPTLGEAGEAAKRAKDTKSESGSSEVISILPENRKNRITPLARLCGSNVLAVVPPTPAIPTLSSAAVVRSEESSNATGSAFYPEIPQSRKLKSRVTAVECAQAGDKSNFGQEETIVSGGSLLGPESQSKRYEDHRLFESASPSFNAQVAFAIWRYQRKQLTDEAQETSTVNKRGTDGGQQRNRCRRLDSVKTANISKNTAFATRQTVQCNPSNWRRSSVEETHQQVVCEKKRRNGQQNGRTKACCPVKYTDSTEEARQIDRDECRLVKEPTIRILKSRGEDYVGRHDNGESGSLKGISSGAAIVPNSQIHPGLAQAYARQREELPWRQSPVHCRRQL